jgi:outer membrane autotransporter protein
VKSKALTLGTVGIGATLLLADSFGDAQAACTNSAPSSGTQVACTGNDVTAAVLAQPGSINVTVDIAAGASGNFTHTAHPVAVSVEQGSMVSNAGTLTLSGAGGSGTLRGAVLLGTGSGNTLTNTANATLNTGGAFNDGMAANGSGNMLANFGTITTSGPNAYGMTAAWGQTNVGQSNNTLLNAGTVKTAGGNARAASILGGSGTIDNRGILTTSGAQSPAAYLQGNNDHLINTGSITASGAGSDAVFSNTAGALFTALIENRAGGQIVSQGAAGIRTLNGNSTVINAGLVQSNAGTAIAMGGGNDALILQTGSSIVGIADGGAGVNTVTLQGAGAATNVFANFQTLLMQGTAWEWSGNGNFTAARVQSGTLTLTGTLGDTSLVAVTIDAHASLQANAQNLPLNVTDNGLLRFQQDGNGTYGGSISGGGALTKSGSGMLSMTSVSTYGGPTVVAAGTLALGDPAHTNAALTGNGGVTVAPGATLGGYGAVSGAVANGGTLAVANALPAFSAGPNGSLTVNGMLTNTAQVRLGAGQGAPGNLLRVVGDYVGQNGTLALDTTLGADGSPSDRLVIDGGSARGTTALQIAHVGGNGAQTVANGIQLVEAVHGASSEPSAFFLAAPVKAGAYTYYLAQGGVTAGTTGDWFLRNAVAPLPAATPQNMQAPLPGVPLAAAGTPPLPAAPPPGAAPIPLYRPEVPLYAAAPGVARQLGLQQIDTFHDRQGDQTLLTGEGTLPAAWGRAWGGNSTLHQQGAADAGFDGALYGVQAGHDLYASRETNGARNHYGILIGFAHAAGDISGFALGTPDLDAGHLSVDAYSIGGYWTHVGASGWYTDALLMGSALSVEPLSRDGIDTGTHGEAVAASLEAGLPMALTNSVTIEPQAQLVWQHLALDDLNDGASNVTFNRGNTVVARLGMRLQGHVEVAGAALAPYLRVSVLRAFGSDDRATFAATTVIGSEVGQTAAQLDAGMVARMGKRASLFATVNWATNLGGSHLRSIGGNAGARWTW